MGHKFLSIAFAYILLNTTFSFQSLKASYDSYEFLLKWNFIDDDQSNRKPNRDSLPDEVLIDGPQDEEESFIKQQSLSHKDISRKLKEPSSEKEYFKLQKKCEKLKKIKKLWKKQSDEVFSEAADKSKFLYMLNKIHGIVLYGKENEPIIEYFLAYGVDFRDSQGIVLNPK